MDNDGNTNNSNNNHTNSNPQQPKPPSKKKKEKKKQKKTLNYISWNVRSFSNNKVPEIAEVLHTYEVDVFLVQETRKNAKEMPALPGFTLARLGYSSSRDLDNSTKTKKSLVAIYIKEDIPYTQVEYVLKRDGGSASCSVEIKYGKKSYHFCSVYYPRGMSSVDTEQFKKFHKDKTDDKIDYIFAGDFNDHSELWSKLEKDKGTTSKLSLSILQSKLVHLNNGAPTRYPDQASQSPSAIDLTFVSPRLGGSHWEVITHQLGFISDHCPIFGSIPIDDSIDEVDFIPSYIYDKANWAEYVMKLSDENNNSPGENRTWEDLDVNDHYKTFHTNVFEVTDKNEIIPKTKFHPYFFGITWWTEECAVAKYNLQVASHNYTQLITKKNKQILDEKADIYKKTVAAAKLKEWEELLRNEVIDYRDSSVLWRKVKKARRGKPSGGTRIIIPNKQNNQGTQNDKDDQDKLKNGDKQTDKDRASILAEHIAKVSQTSELDSYEKQKRLNFENKYEDPIPDNNLGINQPISLEEMEEAIHNLKNKKKATGSDPLNYLMISKLPKNQKLTLLALYNKCLSTGNFPDSWKEAQVFTLLKPGKPASDPSSYRPISLTPHAGKLFEQILKARLNLFLEKNDVIPKEQSGFRQARSTTDNLAYLTEKMKKALRTKYQGMYCTFFDIKKAFDRVWHKKLLSKLAEIGVSGNMYNIIKSFLSNRKMCVRYGNSTSKYHNIDMGVPQGAVLSPTLFTVMLHDILDKVELHGNKIMLYADDIALVSEIGQMKKGGIAGGDPINKVLLDKHQKAINSLNMYINEQGFQFSEEKTQFMCVSRYNIPKREAYIKLNKHIIGHSNNITYLGITFHSELSWTEHFKKVKQKSYKIINLLKILSAQHWARGTKFLVDVARSLIRSLVSYGQECFFSACKTQLEILDTIEHIALRIVLGLPPNASKDNLYLETGWLPLAEERNIRCAEYVIRAQKVEEHIMQEFLNDKEGLYSDADAKKFRFKANLDYARYCEPIYQYTQELFQDANIKLTDVEKLADFTNNCEYFHKNIPLSDITLENKSSGKTKVLLHYTLKGKKSDDMAAAGADANIYVEQNFKHHFKVFTDGSVHSDSSGIGVVTQAPNGDFEAIPLRRGCGAGKCTMSVELEAILAALVRIKRQPYIKNVILTDSLSSMQALKTKPKSNFKIRAEISKAINECYAFGKQIEICHVPSHTSVAGNKRADTEANRGALLDNAPHFPNLSRKECYRLIREAAKKDSRFFTTLSNPKYKRKGYFARGVNPHSMTLYRRIKLNCPWFNFHQKVTGVTQVCPHCQTVLETSHLLVNPCPPLKQEFSEIFYVLNLNNKTAEEVLQSGSILDGIYISDKIKNSSVGYLF